MLVVSLDTLDVYTAVTGGVPVTKITHKRADNPLITVCFTRGGKQTELANGSTGILGLKQKGQNSGGFVASATSWTQIGTGKNAVYVFDLNLNTTELNALFTSDSVAEQSLILEISWQESNRPLTIIVEPEFLVKNDYIKGGENGPISGNESWGLAANYLFRTPVAVPASLASPGAIGQYAFDPVYYRVYVYLGTQWHYLPLISA